MQFKWRFVILSQVLCNFTKIAWFSILSRPKEFRNCYFFKEKRPSCLFPKLFIKKSVLDSLYWRKWKWPTSLYFSAFCFIFIVNNVQNMILIKMKTLFMTCRNFLIQSRTKEVVSSMVCHYDLRKPLYGWRHTFIN